MLFEIGRDLTPLAFAFLCWTSQACRDTWAGPPWGRAPWIYLGVRPDGYVGGPVVKRSLVRHSGAV